MKLLEKIKNHRLVQLAQHPMAVTFWDVVFIGGLGPTLISSDSTVKVVLGIAIGLGLGALTFNTIKKEINK